METRERDVSSYQTEDGVFPFRVWKETLDGTIRNAVNARITRLSTGNFGDSRAVGGGVFESKINLGPGYRIYYGVDGDPVILLGGGDKSTQNADIKQAKDCWKDYKRRTHEEAQRQLQKRTAERSKRSKGVR